MEIKTVSNSVRGSTNFEMAILRIENLEMFGNFVFISTVVQLHPLCKSHAFHFIDLES